MIYGPKIGFAPTTDIMWCWERLPNAIVLKMTFPSLCAKNRFNKQLSQSNNDKSTTMRQQFLRGKPLNKKGKKPWDP